jgi:hypothetical protein
MLRWGDDGRDGQLGRAAGKSHTAVQDHSLVHLGLGCLLDLFLSERLGLLLLGRFDLGRGGGSRLLLPLGLRDRSDWHRRRTCSTLVLLLTRPRLFPTTRLDLFTRFARQLVFKQPFPIGESRLSRLFHRGWDELLLRVLLDVSPSRDQGGEDGGRDDGFRRDVGHGEGVVDCCRCG